MQVVKNTGDWLRGNHILVNDDWLRACVEWIQEENQGNGLTDEDINSQVYEQWLLADLHELETCCLPAELAGSQKYELRGTFALQIDSIVDVGVSFYSQQQKLKGTENANVHVNAEEPTQKPWEPKPSRMLMFKLTDGTHCVQGMEYRPISCLSPQTPPGAKILVNGNILSRHGVLMLSDSNIKFLGGEVDTLVEANTVLNTLQSAMEASEEHAGKEHKQTFAGTPIRHCKQQVSRNQGNQLNSCGNSRSNFNTGNQFSQRGKPDIKPRMKTEPMTQTSFARNNQGNNQNFSDYDAFMDDDMDGLMEEMNDEDFKPSDTVQNRNSKSVTNNSATTNLNANSIKKSYSQSNENIVNRGHTMSSSELTNQGTAQLSNRSNVLFNDDPVAMDFEDDMDFPPMDDEFLNEPNVNTRTGQYQNQNLKNEDGKQVHADHSSSKFSDHSNIKTVKGNLCSGSIHKNINRQINPNESAKDNESDISNSSSLMTGSGPLVLNNVNMNVIISNKGVNLSVTCGKQDAARANTLSAASSRKTSSSATASSRNTNSSATASSRNTNSSATDSSRNTNSSATASSRNTSSSATASSRNTNSSATASNMNTNSSATASIRNTNSSATASSRNTNLSTTASSRNTNSSATASNMNTNSSVSALNRSDNLKSSVRKVKTDTERKSGVATGSLALSNKKHQSSMENYFTPNKKIKHEPVVAQIENNSPDIQTEYPFTYLSKVMSLPVQKDPSYHTVKAYISTLTSKLTSAGGRWSLACKINDGTMAVDVDLSSQVLTEMIGFSPKEAQEMKLRIKTDPGVKEVLQEGIQQCQQKLIELMCLLELEICERNARPVIVATKQLTSHHIDMLYNRVMASWNTRN